MVRPSLVILASLFVVLSGCSSLSDVAPEQPAPTTTDTVTRTTNTSPVDSNRTATPGGTTTSPSSKLAPGITDAGIVNPVALLSAHQYELLAAGYVLNETVVSTYNGSPSNRLVVVTTAGPGGELVHQNGSSVGVDSDGTESTIRNELWVNTTTMVTRHVEAGKTTYRIRPRTYPPEALLWYAGLQRDIQYSAGDFEVTDVEQRDGQRFVTLEANVDRVGNDGVVDTTSTLVVDENGIIRRASMDADYGEGSRHRTTYRVVEVGHAPPSPPSWLASVPPSAALEVGLDVFEFDERSVRLVQTHGDAVPVGSTVTIVSSGTTYRATLSEPLRDERYCWLTSDGTLRVTANQPPTDAFTPFGPEISVSVTAPDGGELFDTSIGRRPTE